MHVEFIFSLFPSISRSLLIFFYFQLNSLHKMKAQIKPCTFSIFLLLFSFWMEIIKFCAVKWTWANMQNKAYLRRRVRTMYYRSMLPSYSAQVKSRWWKIYTFFCNSHWNEIELIWSNSKLVDWNGKII